MKYICMRLLLLCLPIAVLSGCGGAAGAAAVAVGRGIEGSGHQITSSGGVSALGSIFVNGVEYDLTGATITIDGDPASESDLGVGHTVIVEGDINDDGVTGKATRVTAGIALAGPITAVDIAVNRLTVLGQTVEVDAATVIVDKIDGQVLGGLAVGDDVEVSGFADSSGIITARRIAPRGPDTELQLIGYVADLDTAAHRFTLNGAVVDYTSATQVGFDSRSLGGAPVRVTVDSVDGNGVLSAATVTFRDLRLPGAQGDAAALQGWVTRFASATDFDVDGHKVVTTATTNIIGPIDDISAVRLDAFIEVKGKLIADGAVEATEIRTNNLVSLDSVIWGTDEAYIFANLFRVGGSRCNIAQETAVSIDGVPAGVDQLQVGDVATIYEHHVELGELDFLNDGNCQIVAVEHNVRGPLESKPTDSLSFYVMGQRVWIDPEQAASVNGQTGFDTFASLEVGDIVEVSGHTTAEGDILATGIHAGAPAGAYRVTGFARTAGAEPGQFRLGGLTANYGDAKLDGFGPDGPADGDRVLVITDTLPSAGVLQADFVSHSGGLPRGTTMNIVRLNGLVTRFASPEDFDIEGRRVVQAQPQWGDNPTDARRCDMSKAHVGLSSMYMLGLGWGPGELAHFGYAICPAGRTYGTEGSSQFGRGSLNVAGIIQSIDEDKRVIRIGGIDLPLQPATLITHFEPTSDPSIGILTPMLLADLHVGDHVGIVSELIAGRRGGTAVWVGDGAIPTDDVVIKTGVESAAELVLYSGICVETGEHGSAHAQCQFPSRAVTPLQFWSGIEPPIGQQLAVSGTMSGDEFVTERIEWADCPDLAVDAGPDQTVVAGDQVVLEGSVSEGYDLCDGPCYFNFVWSQVAGPPVDLSAEGIRAGFVAPAVVDEVELASELKVSGEGFTGRGMVSIHVLPGP